MAPRSQLEIVTSSVLRLVKEEASYHKELQQQTERVKKLEAETGGDDENREYTIKQEVCTSSIDFNCSTIIAYAN
jgi:tubulin-specific chaperone A